MFLKKFFFFLYFVLTFFFSNIVYSEIVKKIIIIGNERISDETIRIFSNINVDDNLTAESLNKILKEIYSTGFFEDVQVEFSENILKINVIENFIIQNIYIEGVKSQTILDEIKKYTKLKERSSFN